METIFAFKKDKAIFRFMLSPEGELYLEIEGTCNISAKALYGFLLKKGIKEEYIDQSALILASSYAISNQGRKKIKLAAPPEKKKLERPEVIFSLDAESKPFVEKGTNFGEIVIRKPKEENFDIFGNPLPEEQSELDLSFLHNVAFNRETGKLYADEEGYLIVDDRIVHIVPKIDVTLSERETTAFISVATRTPVSVEELQKKLEENEIIYGVDMAALNIIAMKTKVVSKNGNLTKTETTPVAFGVEPEKGEDGWIEWFFNPENELSFEEDEQGNINFKEVNLIQTVKKATTLAVIHSHKPGRDGISVKAKPIIPDPVEQVKLKAGKGMMISGDGTIFISEIDGMVSYSKGTISVHPIYKIEGNVDYSTGNIVFEGTVDVSRDIITGFTVEAARDLVVGGTVEGAEVKSGGNINIKGGVPGQEKGEVEAGGDIFARYIAESNVFCGGNIVVENSILDSNVRCLGSVIASNSSIVGGSLFSNRGIMCKNLGSNMEIPTQVTVGEDQDVYSKYLEISKKLSQAEEDMKVLETDMVVLRNDPGQLQMLEGEHSLLKEKIEGLEKELMQLTKGHMLEAPVYKIAVLRALFPGVRISMSGSVFNVRSALKGPLLIFFNKSKGKISIRNLAKTEIIKIKKQFKKWLEQEENVIE